MATASSTQFWYNGEQNLRTFSEEFDNAAWGKPTASVIADAIADPFGELTAEKIRLNSGVAYNVASGAGVQLTLPALAGSNIGTYTWSIFAKAGEATELGARNNYTGQITRFNLSTGTIIASGSGTPAISSAGNGWYRCSITYVVGSTAASGISFRPYINSAISNGTDGVYIWGASLQRGGLTTYVKTVSTAVESLVYNSVVISQAASSSAEFSNAANNTVALLNENSANSDSEWITAANNTINVSIPVSASSTWNWSSVANNAAASVFNITASSALSWTNSAINKVLLLKQVSAASTWNWSSVANNAAASVFNITASSALAWTNSAVNKVLLLKQVSASSTWNWSSVANNAAASVFNITASSSLAWTNSAVNKVLLLKSVSAASTWNWSNLASDKALITKYTSAAALWSWSASASNSNTIGSLVSAASFSTWSAFANNDNLSGIDFGNYFHADFDQHIMDVLGDIVIYQHKSLKAFVVYTQQNINIQDAYLSTPEIQITALKKDLPNIGRGSVIKHNGKNMVIDAPLNDTSTHITLAANYA